MGKINIKFYLNDRLKSTEQNGAILYPLYLSIIQKRVMSRVKSVFVTNPISKSEFENDLIKEHFFNPEENFVRLFFEFAETAITDYSVSNSKTNLGKMLDFWHNDLYLMLWDYGFLNVEEREQIRSNFVNYFTQKTGLVVSPAFLIKDFSDISLSTMFPLLLEFDKLNKEGVLTDQQTAKIEFIKLLSDEKSKYDNKPQRVFEWYKDKANILKQIRKKAKFCTADNITEFATETDNLIKDTVRHFYSKFYFGSETGKTETETGLLKAENYLKKLDEYKRTKQ